MTCPHSQGRCALQMLKSHILTKATFQGGKQNESMGMCTCKIEHVHPKADSESSDCWIPSYLIPIPGTDTTFIPFPHHLQRKTVSQRGFVEIYKMSACRNTALVSIVATGWWCSEEVCKQKAGRRGEQTSNTHLISSMCAVEREGKDITAVLADFEARSFSVDFWGRVRKGERFRILAFVIKPYAVILTSRDTYWTQTMFQAYLRCWSSCSITQTHTPTFLKLKFQWHA